MIKRVFCALLIALIGMAILKGVQTGAQTISWDAVFVTGVESHYKAFYQTMPLWRFGSLTIGGGTGVTAWRHRCRCLGKGGWYTGWCCWKTYPTILTHAYLPIFTTGDVDIYSISWLSVMVRHAGKLLPEFPRADFFTALGIDFRLSADLAVHGELGAPIGWGSIPPTIGMGFSWRF